MRLKGRERKRRKGEREIERKREWKGRLKGNEVVKIWRWRRRLGVEEGEREGERESEKGEREKMEKLNVRG